MCGSVELFGGGTVRAYATHMYTSSHVNVVVIAGKKRSSGANQVLTNDLPACDCV